MQLTGKCKEDFFTYVYYNEDTNQVYDESKKQLVINNALKWFERQDERLSVSLIIEWFDSVGLYLFFDPQWSCSTNLWWRYHISKKLMQNNIIESDFKTRSQAINSAIKKANDVYNETHQKIN